MRLRRRWKSTALKLARCTTGFRLHEINSCHSKRGRNVAHKIDLVMDFQYGSTGKGAIAGYLAKRGDYDTAVCSFGTQAGHTYIDKSSLLDLLQRASRLTGSVALL